MPYGFIKCAIANFNTPLTNSIAAVTKIEELVTSAAEQNVKIILFPELSLTGYTCQDLFGFSQLLDSVLIDLKELVKFSKKSNVSDIVFVVGAPLNVADVLYNCAIVIQGGKIHGVVPKQYLPNYGEFYEGRWFTPYTDFSLTSIHLLGENVPFGNLIFNSSIGYKLGIEICEDLWSVIPPSSYLALAGANIICNLSASNELVGKDSYREELIKSQSSRTMSGYLYVSSGFNESTSDLVFGGSGYIFENGKKLASMERYQISDQIIISEIDVNSLKNERIYNKTFSNNKQNTPFQYREIEIIQTNTSLENFSLTRKVNSHPFVPIVDNNKRSSVCKEILTIQATGLAKRLSAIGCKTVTIGISGGLDSTLALIVCNEAFKKLGLNTSGIIGITMPGFGTTGRTYNNSLKLCKELFITMMDIPIKDACLQHFKDIGHNPEIHDITYENVQARERTQILMDLANKNGGILVGTGDLSELVLGWCTYNGDHMSMYGVNASIPKTLVKYLIEWYAIEAGNVGNNALKETLLDIISTPISPELLPTDGKKVVQKTEATIGPYEVIDFFIYNLLRKRFSRNKILYLASIAFEGKYSNKELWNYFNNFIIRFSNNQFKRNCLPDGPKVGTVSISPRGDWRMPSESDARCEMFFRASEEDPYLSLMEE